MNKRITHKLKLMLFVIESRKRELGTCNDYVHVQSMNTLKIIP